jgi:glycosidase
LFLPGAVKIYYGEELGLPSVSQGVGPGPQFGIMPWESEIKGFTDSKEKLFFKAISEDQAKELNFKDQNNARHSHLKVFKKLADLRGRDEVFTDGDYKAEKIIGLHVFVRTLSGNDKVK